MTYIKNIVQDGFVVVDSVVDLTTLQLLERLIYRAASSGLNLNSIHFVAEKFVDFHASLRKVTQHSLVRSCKCACPRWHVRCASFKQALLTTRAMAAGQIEEEHTELVNELKSIKSE